MPRPKAPATPLTKPPRKPTPPIAPPPVSDPRADKLRADIQRFADLSAAAEDAGQFAPSVAAATKQAAAEAKLAAHYEAIEIASIADPLARLERLRLSALAAGSHVAASNYGRQIEELRAAREAAARQVGGSDDRVLDASPVAFISGRLREMLATADRATGAARIAALNATVDLWRELETARRVAAEEGEGLTDAEILGKIRDELPHMPDDHLHLFVVEYCTRHDLPLPRRVIVGGAAN